MTVNLSVLLQNWKRRTDILLGTSQEKETPMKKIHLICNAHLDPVWLWMGGGLYGGIIHFSYGGKVYGRISRLYLQSQRSYFISVGKGK